MSAHKPFGNQIPFCEPSWYQGQFSPYYTANHVAFRARVREFVEKELKPNVDKWIKTGYPPELHIKAYEAGLSGVIYPPELGGTKPADFDAFYELIMVDEMARMGGGGVLGQSAINSMALPPIINAGPEWMKDEVCRPVITGRKHVCLAISEPGAGSDVANIRTTAERNRDGNFVVNGSKKWITGGLMADWFTTAVKTGPIEDGFAGISLLLIPRHAPGVRVRKMETQFDNSHSTTFVTFEDVVVPARNLIGPENGGAMLLLVNFNHERFIIAGGACRAARMCFEQAMQFALTRETFGKRLVQHQIIRFKLAEMVWWQCGGGREGISVMAPAQARQIEALHDMLERVAYQYAQGMPDHKMGGQCALLKVQASKTFEYCAREAAQIFGGNSIVKEGKGKLVERLSREVRGSAIPGGSEETLLDLAIRQAVAKADKIRSKL